MSVALEFEADDLSRAEVQALIRRHLAGMNENSPPESVHALDIDKLRQPGVIFWTGWVRDNLAVMGALKMLDAANGEIKSMRVDDRWLGRGYGREMLSHITWEAERRGMKALWLETGSADAFLPALKLYESAGFERCGPFGDYRPDSFSVFMTKTL